MELPIFYAPPNNITDLEIILPAEESRHATGVLRLKKGAMVLVVNGLGEGYRGEIRTVGTAGVKVRIHSRIRNFGEPAVRLTLAAGMSAGSKFDTMVEKGTELGVKRFVPVITEKSKVKMEDARRAGSRVARLERVALAALKQCRRSYRPDIALPLSFMDYLKEYDSEALNLIFTPGRNARPLEELKLDKTLKRINLLVGPEAGFSPEELEVALKTGYQPVSLGERILRAETAGPVVCALIMFLMGELR
ncbi:MAG: RsmE family RNA methyltransferase [candidate division Zixibacteria bacterium]|nr:RsmE family RNA methyltransferase [candidate division Zixibacteria bacterium]MDD5426852.1 RsmE family RNA methyltransferase [candidate division Zixibacteria bacterium]